MEMQPQLRPVNWLYSTKDDLRAMDEDVQDTIGFALFQVQIGIKPAKATVMKGFTGSSILEIKDDFDGDTYRCVYTVKFAEAVYVLHAFKKKSTRGIKTPQKDIDLIKHRLREAEEHYKATYGAKAGGK